MFGSDSQLFVEVVLFIAMTIETNYTEGDFCKACCGRARLQQLREEVFFYYPE